MAFDILVASVTLLYFLVAGFAFFATASEQRRYGVRAFWPRAISMVACLAWPLAACVMLLQLSRKTSRP